MAGTSPSPKPESEPGPDADPDPDPDPDQVCGRYLRVLRDAANAPLWQRWALSRFAVLSSILGAVPGSGLRRAPPDYRALYRMHRELELRRKGMHFEKVASSLLDRTVRIDCRYSL